MSDYLAHVVARTLFPGVGAIQPRASSIFEPTPEGTGLKGRRDFGTETLHEVSATGPLVADFLSSHAEPLMAVAPSHQPTGHLRLREASSPEMPHVQPLPEFADRPQVPAPLPGLAPPILPHPVSAVEQPQPKPVRLAPQPIAEDPALAVETAEADVERTWPAPRSLRTAAELPVEAAQIDLLAELPRVRPMEPAERPRLANSLLESSTADKRVSQGFEYAQFSVASPLREVPPRTALPGDDTEGGQLKRPAISPLLPLSSVRRSFSAIEPAIAAAAGPTIHVTIGRVEVRATPAIPSAKRQPTEVAPVMKLEDYLGRRARGGQA